MNNSVTLSHHYTIWCTHCETLTYTHVWELGKYRCESCGNMVKAGIKDQLSIEDSHKIMVKFVKLVEADIMQPYKKKTSEAGEIIRAEFAQENI